MNTTARAAFIQSQAACAIAEVLGMMAENQHRVAVGRTDLYTEEAFQSVPTRYGLDHNSVISYLRD